MSCTVVQLLELIEVAQHERERVAVALRPQRLRLELANERTPVRQTCQRIVVREELELLEPRRRLERRGCLVREQAQRLHLLACRQQSVRGIVGPHEALEHFLAVEERQDRKSTRLNSSHVKIS